MIAKNHLTRSDIVRMSEPSATSPNGYRVPVGNRFVELRGNLYWHVTNASGRIVSKPFTCESAALRSVGVEVQP